VKIAFLAGDVGNISGGANVIIEYAWRLQALGHEVVLLTHRPVRLSPAPWHPRLPELRFQSFTEAARERFDFAFATWWLSWFDLWRVDSAVYGYLNQSLESRFHAEAHLKHLNRITYSLPLLFVTEARWLADFIHTVQPGGQVLYVRNGLSREHFPCVEAPAPRTGTLRVLVEGPWGIEFKGVAETFAAAFRTAGGSVVAQDPYLPALVEDPTGVDPYLQRALRSGMDALVIAGQADAGIKVVREARRLGFTGPVVGADGMTGVKDAGADAEGIYVSSAFLPDRSSEAAQAFVQAYRQRYNEEPDHRGAMTYDAIKLVAQAIGEVGTDRRAIRDYLARVGVDGSGVAAYEGVSGRIAFDSKGDVPGKEVAMGVVRGGKLVTVR